MSEKIDDVSARVLPLMSGDDFLSLIDHLDAQVERIKMLEISVAASDKEVSAQAARIAELENSLSIKQDHVHARGMLLDKAERRIATLERILDDTRMDVIPFLVGHAVRYAMEGGLDGLHPTHYDLLLKYGARMDDFKRATNAAEPT